MFHLSENLKKHRIINNLTQENVAEYLGVTPQSVSKWEIIKLFLTDGSTL